MRHVLLAAGLVAAITACTPRPKEASGPTLPWDTANSVVRRTSDAGAPGGGGSPADAMPAMGEWTGTLPSASGGGRTFSLLLNHDGSARLATDYGKPGAEPVVETGVWSAMGNAVTVELRRGADGTPSFLAYELTERGLVPGAAWDSTAWGSEGPPALTRR
jgi:hypothetical protein